MKSPFPWFGGKSKVAPAVWQRFGNASNYVEPFAGSLAVLLNRPHEPKTETVNDLDCYIANFWRALQCDPDEVAHWADWPVNEADLHARHNWLLNRAEFRQRMHHDPDYYDAKIAGWWVWGICQWIGSGWCAEDYYDDNGRQQLPHLGDAGRGTNRTSIDGLSAYMQSLTERLRRVRVCCGDWSRVLGDSVTHKHGLTAVFLDPPYSHDLRDSNLYGLENDCAADVRAWAIENGNNPLLRIALCGYADEHAMPDNWECHRWKANGGYGSQGYGLGRDNADKECIWFSPACIRLNLPKQAELFEVTQ